MAGIIKAHVDHNVDTVVDHRDQDLEIVMDAIPEGKLRITTWQRTNIVNVLSITDHHQDVVLEIKAWMMKECVKLRNVGLFM